MAKEIEMKFRTIQILTVIAFLLAFAWLIGFAISDFVADPDEIGSILATKPWRPWCRLIFSVVMGAILIVGTIGFLKHKAQQT